MAKALGSMLEAARIQSEINRLFDNLLDLGGDAGSSSSWIPNADILETQESLVLKIDLPGVDPEKLSISVHGGNLILSGDKMRVSRGEGAQVHIAERQYGPFRRVISLGVPVNTRQATAVMHNGLLRITFPKVPNRRGEEVQIEVTQA